MRNQWVMTWCDGLVRRAPGLTLVSVVALSSACGGAAPLASSPTPPAPSAVSGTAGSGPSASVAPRAIDPFAVPAAPRDEEDADPGTASALDLGPWAKARNAKGVPTPPARCAAYANRAPSKDAGTILDALAEREPAKRDARLVAEGKRPKASAAYNLALRADLAPIECADAIVDRFLQSGAPGGASSANATAAREHPASMRLLVGLSLAGKLARTAEAPPVMGAVREKEKIKAFIGGPLKTWLVDQSTAIEALSSGAAGLSGYARGIAAIEAGIAELRLVDRMRSAPVPATWDPELRAIYEAALDEALEPRKKRGRDAALVGMSDFARVGILRDARLDRARALLSKLYGGRRIDALDALLLPAEAPAPATSPVEVALATVPTFWLEGEDLGHATDPRLLSRGVTKALRERARKEGDGGDGDLRSRYARARLDMGRVYWRRVDFVEAAHAAKAKANERGGERPEDRLVLALALALARGPNGAAEMMRAPSPAALELRHTEALDAVAAEGGPMAGIAAFDAAHLRALCPPEGTEAVAYLRDVAARFRKAEALLGDAAHKKLAAQRGAEVEAIAATAEGAGRK